MSSLRPADACLSSTSSVISGISATEINNLPPNKYLMKTLCLSRKTTVIPNKEEYAKLLTCGLGARKWQVSLDFDAETFHNALLNIYPRLSTVPTYTLWSINKDNKAFEKLPVKVNTPSRIRAYLGSQFTGCIIIMPSEEISLGPTLSEPLAPSRPASSADTQSARSASVSRDKGGRFCSSSIDISNSSQSEAMMLSPGPVQARITNPGQISSTSGGSEAASTACIQPPTRQICLICGRVAKQIGSAAFYSVDTAMLTTETGTQVTIGSRLREVLRVDFLKKRFVPSEEICKKCFRQLNEIDYLDTQLRNAKDDLVQTFFNTVSKIGKVDPQLLVHSGQPLPPHHHHHHHNQHASSSYSHQQQPPTQTEPSSQLMAVRAAAAVPSSGSLSSSSSSGMSSRGQSMTAAGSGSAASLSGNFASHLPHVSEVGVPQRVYLTSPIYAQDPSLGQSHLHTAYQQGAQPAHGGKAERAFSYGEVDAEQLPRVRAGHISAETSIDSRRYINDRSVQEFRSLHQFGSDHLRERHRPPYMTDKDTHHRSVQNMICYPPGPIGAYETRRGSFEDHRGRSERISSQEERSYSEDRYTSPTEAEKQREESNQSTGSSLSSVEDNSSPSSGLSQPHASSSSRSCENGGVSRDQRSSPRQRWKRRYHEREEGDDAEDAEDGVRDYTMASAGSEARKKVARPSQIKSQDTETNSLSTNQDSGVGNSDEDSGASCSGTDTASPSELSRMAKEAAARPGLVPAITSIKKEPVSEEAA